MLLIASAPSVATQVSNNVLMTVTSTSPCINIYILHIYFYTEHALVIPGVRVCSVDVASWLCRCHYMFMHDSNLLSAIAVSMVVLIQLNSIALPC